MKRSLTLLAPTLTLLFFAGTSARADPIPPAQASYLYNWAPLVPNRTVNAIDGTGGVTFTDEPKGTGTGNSDIVATNLNVFSSADPSKPEHLGTNGAYSLQLILTDKASGLSKTLVFTGKLSDPVGGGAFSSDSANVQNTFTGTTKVSFSLGAYDYTVAMVSYAPPGPPSQSLRGSIGAHVTVSTLSTGGTGGTSGGPSTPEPSAMLLSCLGLSFLGAASWRKRRAKVAVTLA
jgi:hypothetical protein